MLASHQSSTESAIFAALKANNPFERPPIVREQNIWSESFPDIPSLNAKASDSLFDAVNQVRTADSDLEKITSLVFLSDRGVGKSHVVKRIRKKLQATSEGIFIYASADRYGDLSLIDSLFQKSIAESLNQQGGEGVTQWQEIAALIVSDAMRLEDPTSEVFTATKLVEKFDQIYLNKQARGQDLIRTAKKLLPRIDDYILRALVWTLSEERGSLATKWLAGEQLSTEDADYLRLPNNKSEESTNSSALTTISNLISLIGEYKTVVICFDELDTPIFDEEGHKAPYHIVNLVKRLFNSVRQSKEGKGVVFLTSALPNAWNYLKQSIRISLERISAYGDPINLTHLNEESAVELCSLTLKRFYDRKGLIAPNPVYPFSTEEIIAYSRVRPFAREALGWFATRLDEILKTVDLPSLSSYEERFEKAYHNALNRFDTDDLEDNEIAASALRFSFEKIAGVKRINKLPIEGINVKSVEEIAPKSQNNGRLHFKIVGKENGKNIAIGLGVIQETNGRSVGAGFRRLLKKETFGLSRGCLVRSRDRKIKEYWDSFEYYQQLVKQGGEWVDLTIEEIKPLLALQFVYEHHGKLALSIEQLDSFTLTSNLLQNNPLIRKILSLPKGQIAEDAIENGNPEQLSSGGDLKDIQSNLLLAEENNSISETEAQSEMQEFADAISA